MRERERERGREKKRKNLKDRLASLSFFCDPSFLPVIMKFTFYVVSVLLKELTEAYMVIEMLLAQQSREKRKDRHKLEHDNLTVPTQLVPAGAL